MSPQMTCGACESRMSLSPVVSVVLLFAPGLERPYPLIPGEEYQLCTACNAIMAFVQRAAEAHPETREAHVGPWQRAIVVYDDGKGAEVMPGRKFRAMA